MAEEAILLKEVAMEPNDCPLVRFPTLAVTFAQRCSIQWRCRLPCVYLLTNSGASALVEESTARALTLDPRKDGVAETTRKYTFLLPVDARL